MKAKTTLGLTVVVLCTGVLLSVPADAKDRNAKVQEVLTKADSLLQVGDFRDARTRYRRALRLSGDTSTAAYLGLIRSQLGLEEYENVAEISRKALDLVGEDAPDRGLIFFLYGQARML